MTLMRYAGLVLALGLLFPVHAGAYGDAAARAAQDGGDIQLAADYGQTPKAESPKTDEGAPEPAPDGGAAAPNPADAPGTPLHDCRLRCGENCKTFANEGLAAQCRGSCEAKCEAAYGQ